MTQHSSWSYGTAAVTGGLLGAVIVLWTAGPLKPRVVTQRPAEPLPAAPWVEPAQPAEQTQWSGLQLSPAASIEVQTVRASHEIKGGIAKRSPRFRRPTQRAKVSPGTHPLNLNLSVTPGSVARIDTAPDFQYHQVSGNHAATAAGSKVVVFPALGLPNTPEPTSPGLFNRDNGLRGFMARNWVNPRFGVQGGLAIRQGRLQNDNSPLQDNIAVGMGVLLAF